MSNRLRIVQLSNRLNFTFYIYFHLLVWRVAVLQARDGKGGLCQFGTSDKEQAVGIDVTDAVIDGCLVDSCRQLGIADGQLAVVVQRLEVLEAPFVHDGESERLLAGEPVGADVEQPLVALTVDLQRHAVRLDVADSLADRPAVGGIGEQGFVGYAILGGEDEGAPTSVFSDGRGNDLLIGKQLELSAAHLAVGQGGFESHTARLAEDEIAPFGEERQHEVGRRRRILELAPQGAERHVAREVAWLLGAVIDGEDARVELFVVAEIVLCHFPVVELLFADAFVLVLCLSPVELPSGVGTELEVTAVERVGESEESASSSFHHFHEFALHEITVVVQQFDVEDAADAAGTVRVCRPCVGGKPNGVAEEVAGVVCMEIDFFLGNVLPEALQAIGHLLEWR